MPIVAGDLGHIAKHNALDAERAAWTAFTPVLTQGVTLTVTANSTTWTQIGKLVVVHYRLGIGSAGTATAAITVTLPTNAATTLSVQSSGLVIYQDLTGATTNYFLTPTSGAAGSFTMAGTTAAAIFGNSPAVTAASGDAFNGTISYESA